MQHRDPALIDQLLQRENQGAYLREGQPCVQPVQYFIPYLFLNQRQTTTLEEAEAVRQVRGVLHSYVFIHASAERVQQLVDSDWNRGCVSQLSFKRSHGGEPLCMVDDEMQRFIATLKSSQLRYFVGQPLSDFTEGDSVTLHLDPWEGHHAVISHIALHDGHARLTVSMDLMGDIIRITFPDIREGDVTIDDPDRKRLLSGNLLGNFEDEVIKTLGHKSDTALLHRIYAYRDIHVDDPGDLRRFTALMLICAHLLGDRDARDAYLAQLDEWLSEAGKPRTDTEAYMTTAIFVATRNPELRDAVKSYLRATPDASDALRRLFAKAKRLRCR
jgi:transcription antitermination factor NusG